MRGDCSKSEAHLVPKRRLELLQACAHQTLNLARLPLPPLRHLVIITSLLISVKAKIQARVQHMFQIKFSIDSTTF